MGITDKKAVLDKGASNGMKWGFIHTTKYHPKGIQTPLCMGK
jgi:hypothetical protein